MNIFFLHYIPYICSLYHCDQHVVKMILEYAQLLSTAHRVLDGKLHIELTSNDRKIKRYHFHPSDDRENTLYKATHINHPSAVWVRESISNYLWLYNLFCCLCDEFKTRYNKIHLSDKKLRKILKIPPQNIHIGPVTPIPQAMPDEYKIENNSLDAYRTFYIFAKSKFATWNHSNTPWWYKH